MTSSEDVASTGVTDPIDGQDNGPREDIPAVPVVCKTVVYCQICSVPPEYCEYGPSFPKCKQWLSDNVLELYEKLYKEKPMATDGVSSMSKSMEALSHDDPRKSSDSLEPPDKKKKVVKNMESKEAKKEKVRQQSKVTVKRLERNKRKFVTAIHGLEVFDVDLKKAAKIFAQKFACGGSVTKNNQGQDEIVVQGDVADEIVDIIKDKYPQVPADNILQVEGKGGK